MSGVECGLVSSRDLDSIKNRYQKDWSIWNVAMEKDGKDQLDSTS